MGFKNVFLEVEESKKWANYFENKYGAEGEATGDYRTWSGLTINENQSIFVATKWVNRDDPYEIELYYFWHGQLFSINMRQIWGEDGLEAWNVFRLMSYPELTYERGIHLPQPLENDKEQILQDLKEAMIVYGDDGTKSFNPPLPNIQIRMGGDIY